ncbi:MAG: hypothetical protein U9R17_02810 [Thermodesulfobacteriota bacterium]|nr:hypothetical protein [Thermodesulfobacteriota bacterium]
MKWIIVLCTALVFTIFLAHAAQADELSVMKEELRTMQKALEAQTKKIEEMQKKIEALESESRSAIEDATSAEGEITALRDKIREPHRGDILSRKGAKFEIGGELEIEFVDTQRDEETDELEPHFQVDRLKLSPKVKFSEQNVSMKADIDVDTDGAELDEVYIKFSKLPLKSSLKIGLDDMFLKPDIKTERYPLSAIAFWRQEETGIFLKSKFYSPFYLNLSYCNGLELDDKKTGEDSSYKIIGVDKRNKDFSDQMELGIGLGSDLYFGTLGMLDVLGFYYLGELSNADIEFLNDKVSGYDSTESALYRYGINLDYNLEDFNLFLQFIRAKDGALNRYAWYIQPSYKFNLPWDWRYFNSHTLLARYGRLHLTDIDAVFTDPLTWDRGELTLAFMPEIYKNIKLKAEYTINTEKTGNGKVDNNEFLIQLELGF